MLFTNDYIQAAGTSAEARTLQEMQEATQYGDGGRFDFQAPNGHLEKELHWHKNMDQNLKDYPLNKSQRANGVRTTAISYAEAAAVVRTHRTGDTGPNGKLYLEKCRHPIPKIPHSAITDPDLDHSKTAYIIMNPAGGHYTHEHVYAMLKERGCNTDLYSFNPLYCAYVWEVKFKSIEARQEFCAQENIFIQQQEADVFDPNTRTYRATMEWLSIDTPGEDIVEALQPYAIIEDTEPKHKEFDGMLFPTNEEIYTLTIQEGVQVSDIPVKLKVGKHTAFLRIYGQPGCINCGLRGHYKRDCKNKYCVGCSKWIFPGDKHCKCGPQFDTQKLKERESAITAAAALNQKKTEKKKPTTPVPPPPQAEKSQEEEADTDKTPDQSDEEMQQGEPTGAPFMLPRSRKPRHKKSDTTPNPHKRKCTSRSIERNDGQTTNTDGNRFGGLSDNDTGDNTNDRSSDTEGRLVIDDSREDGNGSDVTITQDSDQDNSQS
jgi:hypothetical protein